jgi:DNA (cytosine-5)-methyltransferase 1
MKTVVSLFSCCGGMDLGFEGGFTVFKPSINISMHPDWIENEISFNKYLLRNTTFRIEYANDINKYAKAAWCNYFSDFDYPSSTYKVGNIVDLIKNNFNNYTLFPKGVSVLTGGFSCQDFSLSGKRLVFQSTKSHADINDFTNII